MHAAGGPRLRHINIFTFINHKVAIKNNDKHKKLKVKYINLTKLNENVLLCSTMSLRATEDHSLY